MVLTSGLALSEASDRSFNMLWPLNAECSAPFEALFENRWNVRSISDAEYLTDYHFPYHAIRFPLHNDTAEQIRVHHSSWLIAPSLYPAQAPLRKRIFELLGQMKPTREIQDRIDIFRQTYFSDAMIGVHLRMGDKYGMNTNARTAIPRAIQAVDEYLEECPSAKIFLCTDDGAPHPDGRQTVTHGVRTAFTKRYGARIVRTMPHTMQRWKLESIQDALIDLMLLRSTQYLIGTEDSSFSLIASHSTHCIKRRMIKIDMPPMTILRRTARALGLHAPASTFTARYPSWGRILWAIKTITIRLNR